MVEVLPLVAPAVLYRRWLDYRLLAGGMSGRVGRMIPRLVRKSTGRVDCSRPASCPYPQGSGSAMRKHLRGMDAVGAGKSEKLIASLYREDRRAAATIPGYWMDGSSAQAGHETLSGVLMDGARLKWEGPAGFAHRLGRLRDGSGNTIIGSSWNEITVAFLDGSAMVAGSASNSASDIARKLNQAWSLRK